MSVYSGFATRQQESFYNKLLERMVQLLSLKLLQSMKKIEDLLVVN
jgi:7,8-dihydro-6-hydroxymethylpterin-pyrophosphokinase